jgi:hypothetical protein
MKKITSLGYLLFGFGLILIVLTQWSCRKEEGFIDGKAKLRYETDTLSFDTVFTAVGSATKYFKIYNDEKLPKLVDIKIKKSNSQFRMNVDGFKGNDLKNIEIPANDSIYVFLEVTVNPNSPLSVSPFIIEDNVLIQNGDKEESVLLVANGQNANYIPRVNGAGTFSYLSCNFSTVNWNDPKPYVIYGILIIDSCTLNLPAGARIYVHGGIARNGDDGYYNDGQIIILGGGSLRANGTLDKKVTFQGTRLEQEFANVAGQWGGIRFFKGSGNNKLNHTEIKNSIIGISTDSATQLSITNAVIKNTSSVGIAASRSNIYGDNLLIYDTGSSALSIGYGGTYEFYHCSFYTSINQDPSIAMSNFKCPDPPLCQSKIFSQAFLNFTMKNSIISGGSDDEINLIPFEKTHFGTIRFSLDMQNNIVRVTDLIKAANYPNFFDFCKGCYNQKREDKVFKSTAKSDFRLDSLSVAFDRGNYISSVPIDLVGKQRNTTKVDLGCYEFDK